MLKRKTFIVIMLIATILNIKAYSQTDTLKNYWLSPVKISAKKINLGDYTKEASKDKLSNIFAQNGFSLIRKGVFFAQDVYADGFKKGDINIVIDGERYHNACPNRMDTPLIRVNPIELQSVSLSKNSGNIQAGLGGLVEFKRIQPQKDFNTKVALSATTGAQNSLDLATSTNFANNMLNVRFVTGKPYNDAAGNSFKDNYGYKDNNSYKLADVSFRGMKNKIKYGASFLYTDNVLFPYLKMDERITRVYSAFLRYDKHKIYFNYTRHIMDNGLRSSKMLMQTDAKNLTIGAIGDFYELIYNNWDAGNFLRSDKFDIQNSLMPNVSTFTANLFKSFSYKNLLLHGKLGLVYHNVGNKERESFYKKAFNQVKLSKFYPTFSFGFSYSSLISKNVTSGLMFDGNSESPEPEELFIAVKKPMGKPAWTGNPNLNQPIKITLRGMLSYDNISLELYGTKVWNYIILVKKKVNNQMFLTFDNIDAIMYGIDLNANYKYLELNAAYIWAENNTNNLPLAEIPPLNFSVKLITPKYFNVFAYTKFTYNSKQNRVYKLLNEKATPSWNKLDIGVVYSFNELNVSLEIENLTNSLYYQHLSYLRDPFASGKDVFEPGRTIRLSFSSNKLF